MANRFVLEQIYESAKSYQKMIGYNFLIKSSDFKYRESYLVRFNPDNFLHLTGVKSNVPPKKFYQLALNRKLKSYDFDCDSSEWLRDIVNKKLRNLINIDSFFDNDVMVVERFSKGSIYCTIATSNYVCTIGFIGKNFLVPKTNLYGNKLLKLPYARKVRVKKFPIICK